MELIHLIGPIFDYQDGGVHKVKYTSTAINNSTSINNRQIMFVEEYGRSVESSENAFTIFIKNISSYIQEAAENFNLIKKGFNSPIPMLPISYLEGDDIASFNEKVSSIVDGKVLIDFIAPPEVETSGFTVNNRIATYLGCFMPPTLFEEIKEFVDIPY
eukprot:TRINITY_DN2095_c0_g1_i1.p1 TRINITY_DN2095_c0_g1~~TRINITY_DN2095_c0_g1_i1.p1  ORF type:complete len:159 (+),score=38.82 TRINITY_DN2095_c0_g1_i1:704-1180(+)